MGVKMNNQPLTAEQERAVQSIYLYAVDLLNKGYGFGDVHRELVKKGLDQSSAEAVVSNLRSAQHNAKKSAAQRAMLMGAVFFIGGILVTGITYSAAADGGTYVVTWGAII